MPSSTDRIADELHDGPQQLVTAIRLMADAGTTALAEGDTSRTQHALTRIVELADETAAELKRIAAGARR
jgi:signal transduction histidine kinase